MGLHEREQWRDANGEREREREREKDIEAGDGLERHEIAGPREKRIINTHSHAVPRIRGFHGN